MSDLAPPTELLSVLVRLRQWLVDSPLPFDAADADAGREARDGLITQLDDYVVPRLVQLDAPMLVVVGGSTGAGKSTLVNSLVGTGVSRTGVLRPTTRSPVLVHHPDDAHWFGADRLLPDLERSERASGGHNVLHVVPTDAVPPGLAILDAPDVDSVEERNRALAAQLLAAADLWLFVTSAARYADQVPWDYLRLAAERSTAVAVVLDRTQPAATREVSSHLARMLTSRGLGDSPLFTVPESPLDESGLLPADAVGPIRDWLDSLAEDAEARNAIVRKTLGGALASLGRRTRVVAAALATQQEIAASLRRDVDSAYAAALAAVEEGSSDGTLLRGEVLTRWQEFVGTGELLKSLEQGVGRMRDRLVSAVRGRSQPAQRVSVAVESGLQTLIVEHAEDAAERAALAWRSLPAGKVLLDEAPADIGRASRDLRGRVERLVRDWQGSVLELVSTEGGSRRTTARFLAYGVNGLGVALMIVIFASTAGVTGAEIGVAGGTAVLGQKILEAVFGDQAVRRLAELARRDLHARVAAVWEEEKARYVDVLDAHPITIGSAPTLLQLCRELDDARLAEAGRWQG